MIPSVNSNIKYFLYLIPSALVTGPFLPDLFLTIIAIYSLFFILKNKIYSVFKNKYSYFFFLFYFYLIFNSLISDYPIESISTSIFYVRYFFFILGVFIIASTSDKFSIHIFYSFSIPILFISFDVIFQYLFGFNFFGFEMSEFTDAPGRHSGIFRDELILGTYISRLLPLTIALWLTIDNEISPKNYIFIFICFFAALIAGERIPIFLLGLFIIIFFFIRKQNLSSLFKISIFSILFITFIFFNPQVYKRVIGFTAFQITEVGYNPLRVSKEHNLIFTNAILQFSAKPITGVGPNNFRYECKNFNNGLGCNTHPHNNTLQLLAETGIVGFTFYLIYIFIFTKIFLTNFLLRKHSINLYLSLNSLIVVLPIIPSLNFFNNYNCVLIFLSISLSCSYLIDKKKLFKV